jgi:hypothetical protein
VTSDPAWDYTLPEVNYDTIRFRATPLFYGYAPEDCAEAYVTSETFATVGASCQYAVVFWGGWSPRAA